MNQQDTESLWRKLQAFTDGLTPEEWTALRLVLSGAGGRVATGVESDVQGHMAPLYDDGLGNKARPQPTEGTGGGGNFGGLIPQQYKDAWNLIRGLQAHNIIPTSITWPPY